MKYILPIGTVVRLTGGEKRLMIIGYFPQMTSGGKIYDFIGCLYPEGFLDADNFFMFNMSDIEKVDFVGFVDTEGQVYIELIKQKHPNLFKE